MCYKNETVVSINEMMMAGRSGDETTLRNQSDAVVGKTDGTEPAVETGHSIPPKSADASPAPVDAVSRLKGHRAVLVLGMHRSGTSVVTGTLTRLGLGGPSSPVPPNWDNPAGFYESTTLVELNDRILAALGSNYHDWRAVDTGVLDQASAAAFEAEAIQRYADEYGATRLAAVKDPRMCRLVPFWRRTLDRAGVAMRVVIVYRSPVEVASSLTKRNGFSAATGLLLWLRHVLDSERHTRDLPRCFVGLDDFMDDWRASVTRIAASLDIGWTRRDDEVDAEIDGYISKPLRHNVSTPQDASRLHRWVAEVDRALHALTAEPNARDALAVLDRIGAQFDAASDLFSRTAQEGFDWAHGLLGEIADLKARLEDAEDERGRLEAAEAQIERDRHLSAALEAAQLAARESATAQEIERERLMQGIAAAHSEAARLRDRHDRHPHVISQLREAIALRAEYIARLADEAASAKAALERRETELARLQAELDSVRREAREAVRDRDAARADAKAQALAVAGLVASPARRIATVLRSLRRLGLRLAPASQRDTPHPGFDLDWYLARYADVRESGHDPYRHYLDVGAGEGRNPSAEFDTDWYRARYPDIRADGIDPLTHYWQHGRHEGRLPGPHAINPHFDEAWYIARYGDEADLGIEPYHHYLTRGAAEGRDPSPLFSTNGYLAAHPDVRDLGLNPLVHYWLHGEAERRRVPTPLTAVDPPDADRNPFFDPDWYRAQYADVRASGLDPYRHYLDVGAGQGRNPSAAFDTNWYLERYPDVRATGSNPLVHYWESGRAEGRLPGPHAVNPYFDADWYAAQYGGETDIGSEPYHHYLTVGAWEGRDPGPDFSTNAYLREHADVRTLGVNPLHHYWRHGAAEGRTTQPSDLAAAREPTNPYFDRDWYLERYADVRTSGLDPYRHYLEAGAAAGYNPSPTFDTNWYLDRYADIRASGSNPLIHYWLFGQAEGRFPGPDALNPHFDTAWYVAQYAGEADLGVEPYNHYLSVGAAEGRDPSPVFSTNAYLAANPDVRESGVNPLHHYWQFGAAEGRSTQPSSLVEASEPANPYFDGDWYLERYADARTSGLDPYRHYLEAGAAAGYNPSPVFSTNAYLAANPDVRESGVNPLHHYWQFGAAEGRSITPSSLAGTSEPVFDALTLGTEFDPDFYFFRYPDVQHNGADPWQHYRLYGEPEGRFPNAVFDPLFYRDVYADVRSAGGGAFEHYRTTGVHEGRLPAAIEQPTRAGGSRILFIGHDSYAAGAQRVLLEIIGWFRRHTLYDIAVLLLGSGHLTTDYARLARTFTVAGDVAAEADEIRRFVGPSPDVVYCNTVVAGRALIPELSDLFSRSIVIAHCHELANIIGQFPEPFGALCRRADRWIGASPATTDLLRADPALQGRSIETVQAFIRPSALSDEKRSVLRLAERRALGIGPDALVVIGCGTVHWRKDPAIFVETAIELLSRDDALDIAFVWVGDGEDTPDLLERIEEVGLTDRIRITGYRSNAGDLMVMGDVFFLSSLEDPFPLVVLEAGQFGIPAVCFDHATGMRDLIERCGRVVPERSPLLAADALFELLNDAGQRARCGAALRTEVLENYVIDVQIPRILDTLHQAGAKPAVSIVVPNYNHAPFLQTRLKSLFSQTMQDFEIVILDDASQDESLRVIEPFTLERRTRLVVNDSNSGSSFRQWQRGIALARSDVIWIAESDDSCEPDFLEILAPHMLRADVNIAFGRTVIMDEAGTAIPGALKPYLDRMAPDFGETAFARSGAGFVNDGFGAICAIVNASGALLRRSVIERALPEACEFRMCGDWRVYLEAMNGGSVAYEPTAINYFRRHTASTVHRLEGTNLYFDERLRIARYVAEHFRTTPAIRGRMQRELQHEADRFRGRYDASLSIDLASVFAASPQPDFIDDRVHALFYVHGMLFSTGGIERLFSMISTALVERGFRVSLVCAPHIKAAVPVFALRPEVEITTADITVPSGVATLRRTLETRQVDVFVPMLSEKLFESAFEAAEGLGIAVVASEHNNPSAIEERWWSREGRLATFAKADAIHLVADIFAESLPGDLRTKVQVIPHAIAPAFAHAVRHPTEPPTIVAVGRLASQKRFDLLIKAFARLTEDFPDWRLVIYGEGAERQRLSGLIEALDLSESVDLPGTTPDMVGALERASLFVLSSEFEATGLALVEALAVGMPVVAFAACEGNSEVICDGVNGLLAPDFTPTSLAGAMRRMMSDPSLRERCGLAAQRVRAKFDLDHAADRWENLILAQAATRPFRSGAS